jgi:hypothetical protein
MPKAKKCQLCNNINLYFETIESYNIHLRDNHASNVPADYIGDAYQCNICKKFFDQETDFVQHILSAH